MNPLDAVLPRRLGPSFRWLFGANVISNLGDGIALAASPLLVASLTSNPFLVSLAPLMQQLPHVVFGLHAGVFADRWDRKRMVVVADLIRAVILAVLVAMLWTHTVTIALVLAVTFALGTAEVVADSASRTLLPSSVEREHLGAANQRLMGAFLVTNQFVGPPLGALLFAAGLIWPFGLNVLCAALGAVLISRMVVRSVADDGRQPTTVSQDIRDGMRWVWHHAAIRTLTITILVFNITWGAAWSVLVLWAKERVGLSEVGFGTLMTMSGVGGVLGTLLYGKLDKRVSAEVVMKVCLTLEVTMHLVMALIRSAPLAYLTMLVFGTYAFIWGTLSGTLRQRAVPHELQGRVGSVTMLATMGGMVIGTPLGGFLARTFGLTAPNWFAFGGAGLTLLLLWRQLSHVAHAGDVAPVDAEPQTAHQTD